MASSGFRRRVSRAAGVAAALVAVVVLTDSRPRAAEPTLPFAAEMNLHPVASVNPDAPICASGQTPTDVFADDLENGPANWSMVSATGPIHWTYDSPDGGYAHSGSHFLAVHGVPQALADTYVEMVAGVTVPDNAQLHFAHAFTFITQYYDGGPQQYTGGVVEYTIDNGITWIDAGPLFDYTGYTGQMDGRTPLGLRSAFVGSSHGYISSRLDLSSLSEQTVRFRWRMGLSDPSPNDFSSAAWWLDDVRLYTCSGPGPSTATLVSPSGSIATRMPAYTWNVVPEATWYYLWVANAAGTPVIQKWYRAYGLCGTTTCSVSPPVPLTNGETHKWWIQTWNSGGYGAWSSSSSFTIPAPPAATLVSPSGAVATQTPTYTWNKVAESTWYYLWVNNAAGDPVIQTWFTSSSVCGASTCSIMPSTMLTNFETHQWWIQTWTSAAGSGPWSASLSFTPSVAPPPAATLVSPSGTITTAAPTYIWNRVADSTWYYLWVAVEGGSPVIQTWNQASAVCGASTCSTAPPAALMHGQTYLWWIQTWNGGGYGPWSGAMAFTP